MFRYITAKITSEDNDQSVSDLMFRWNRALEIWMERSNRVCTSVNHDVFREYQQKPSVLIPRDVNISPITTFLPPILSLAFFPQNAGVSAAPGKLHKSPSYVKARVFPGSLSTASRKHQRPVREAPEEQQTSSRCCWTKREEHCQSPTKWPPADHSCDQKQIPWGQHYDLMSSVSLLMGCFRQMRACDGCERRVWESVENMLNVPNPGLGAELSDHLSSQREPARTLQEVPPSHIMSYQEVFSLWFWAGIWIRSSAGSWFESRISSCSPMGCT